LDAFVNSSYDDTFTVTISGSSGTPISATVASVKLVGAVESTALNSNAWPDLLGGAALEHSGWQSAAAMSCTNCVIPSFDISELGETITVTFTVADVADTAYSSAVTIDNVRFGN
jgi:hypothetical protein